jgi:hypothetical protein
VVVSGVSDMKHDDDDNTVDKPMPDESLWRRMEYWQERALAAEAELARLRHPAVQHVVWRAAILLEWCAESIPQTAPVPNDFPSIPELRERADQLRALARSLIITDQPVELASPMKRDDDIKMTVELNIPHSAEEREQQRLTGGWDRWYASLPEDLKRKLSIHDFKRLGDCFRQAFDIPESRRP